MQGAGTVKCAFTSKILFFRTLLEASLAGLGGPFYETEKRAFRVSAPERTAGDRITQGLLLQAQIGRNVEVNPAHLETPFARFLDQQIFVAARQ